MQMVRQPKIFVARPFDDTKEGMEMDVCNLYLARAVAAMGVATCNVRDNRLNRVCSPHQSKPETGDRQDLAGR